MMVQTSAFFPILKYSIRIFVKATNLHGGGNGNSFVFNLAITALANTNSLIAKVDYIGKKFIAGHVTNSIYEIFVRTYLSKDAFPVLWILFGVIYFKTT